MELFSVEGTELENKSWRLCEEFLTMRLVLITKHLPTYQRSGVSMFWDNHKSICVMIPTWNFIGLMEIVILSPTQLFKQLFKDTQMYTHLHTNSSSNSPNRSEKHLETSTNTGKDWQRHTEKHRQRHTHSYRHKTNQPIGRLSQAWDCWHLRYQYWIYVPWPLDVDVWIDMDQFKMLIC